MEHLLFWAWLCCGHGTLLATRFLRGKCILTNLTAYGRNMFLAAVLYFKLRFESNAWIDANFQSAILTVSTITNLGAMIVLQNIQATANYPFRINLALVINTVIFTLLTGSTVMFTDVSAGAYLFFLLCSVALTAYACGLIQNGAFAFAAGFGRPEYTQALMAGQGVAGVLPPIAQIVSVLWIDDDDASEKAHDGGGSSSISAFVYFLTAVGVSLAALVAFQPLKRRHDHIVANRMVEQHMSESVHSIEEAEQSLRKVTSMQKLFRELHWVALALFFTFVLTMFYPVFTQKILSVRDPDTAPALFQPRAFVPFAFFMWNLGDLSGRASTILDFKLRHKPLAMFLISLARVGFLPMYLMCNIGGRGAKVDSDLFYLFAVQFLFGVTNGWMGSSTMMNAIESVDEAEREATGGFMGLCLVAGLTVGSLLSFTAGGI